MRRLSFRLKDENCCPEVKVSRTRSSWPTYICECHCRGISLREPRVVKCNMLIDKIDQPNSPVFVIEVCWEAQLMIREWIGKKLLLGR